MNKKNFIQGAGAGALAMNYSDYNDLRNSPENQLIIQANANAIDNYNKTRDEYNNTIGKVDPEWALNHPISSPKIIPTQVENNYFDYLNNRAQEGIENLKEELPVIKDNIVNGYDAAKDYIHQF